MLPPPPNGRDRAGHHRTGQPTQPHPAPTPLSVHRTPNRDPPPQYIEHMFVYQEKFTKLDKRSANPRANSYSPRAGLRPRILRPRWQARTDRAGQGAVRRRPDITCQLANRCGRALMLLRTIVRPVDFGFDKPVRNPVSHRANIAAGRSVACDSRLVTSVEGNGRVGDVSAASQTKCSCSGAKPLKPTEL